MSEPEQRKKSYSLRKRLALISSIVLLMFIGLTALSLDQAFKQSLQAELNERLQTQMYLVLGAAEWQKSYLKVPKHLDAPRFNQVDSGLFAFIRDGFDKAVWQSQSAQHFTSKELLTALPTLLPGGQLNGEAALKGERYFYLAMGIAWEVKGGELKPFTFYISESSKRYETALKQYRLYLWVGLAIMAVILIIVFATTLYWGLGPLRHVENEVIRIEAGLQDQIQGHYPKELSSLTESLNRLIEHEQKQHTRYRNTLGNLAHSLKTPLAVLQGIVDSTKNNTSPDKPEEQTQVFSQQIQRMNDIVQHQLQRASHVAPESIRKLVTVQPVVERLTNAIEKIYSDRINQIEMDVPSHIMFRGDEGDLMELLGNLLENAGKYGNGKIKVSATHVHLSGSSKCKIVIEDNGPGITEDKAGEILLRGIRADEKNQGQGIGLAVVVDLVDMYGGKMNISKSELGGAKFEVVI